MNATPMLLRVAPSSTREILHEVFGYGQFRGPQQDVIDHVVAGGDALVLMPTGGGKPQVINKQCWPFISW